MFSSRDTIERELILLGKQAGMSDKQMGETLGITEDEMRELRIKHDVKPWVKQVRIKLTVILLVYICLNWFTQLINSEAVDSCNLCAIIRP